MAASHAGREAQMRDHVIGSGIARLGLFLAWATTTPLIAAAQPAAARIPAASNASGAVVAFVSDADLGYGVPAPGLHAIYIADRAAGALALVAQCRCSQPSLSLDGNRVVFRDDGVDGRAGVFYKDTPFNGDAIRVDVNASGAAASGTAIGLPRLSGDGRYVAFASTSNLDDDPGDPAGSPDLFVRDLMTARTERWTIGARISGSPSISADGRLVAFVTSTRLLPEDANDIADVYVLDRGRPTSNLRLLPAADAGAQAGDVLVAAGASAIAFTSTTPGGPNGAAAHTDVYVADLRAGTLTRASVTSGGDAADTASSLLAISGNGRRVAFATSAGSVYVHDLSTGETTAVPADAGVQTGVLTPDGRSVLAWSPSSHDFPLVALPPDAPAGAGVRGDPFDPVTGQNPLTLVFSGVTVAGNVSIALEASGPALPGGLVSASPFFQVSGTAITAGDVRVCVADDADDGASMRLLRLDRAAWTDITGAPASAQSVCGTTPALGTYVLARHVSSDATATTSGKTINAKSPAISNVVSWNVDADGYWDDATNWSGGVVPADGDTVVIDRPNGSFTITVRTPTANVLSVFANEALVVNSTLTVSGTATFNGGLTLTGTLTGTGTATLGATASWIAAGQSIIGLAGGVDVNAGVTLTLTGIPANSPTFYLIDSALRNHGTVAWNAGLLTLRNSSSVTSDAGTLWDVQGDLTITSDGNGSPSFTNNGTLRKSAGTGQLTLAGNVAYSSSGTVDLQTGTIGVGPGFTNSGLLQLAASTTFYLAQVTLLPSTTFAGSGLLHANGNTTIPGSLTISLPLLITGTVTGAGTLHLATNTTWNAPGQSIINLAGGVDVNAGFTFTLTGIPSNSPTFYLIDSALRNHGTVVWNAGLLTLRNSSSVTNDAGRLWDVQGDFTITSDGNGSPSFANNGTLRKSAGTGQLTLAGTVAYSNSGTLDLQTGTIGVGPAQLANSGLLQLAASTTFYLAQVTLLPGTTFAGSGLLHANGNTTIPGDLTITLPLLVTGTLTGTGTLHLAANTTWNAPGQSIINLAGGVDVNSGVTFTLTGIPANSPTFFLIDSSLRNHGTVVWNTGTLIVRNSSSVTNDAGKLWDVQGDLTITSDGNGAPAFTNAGILRKSAGTGQVTLGGSIPFVNTGTIDLETGSVAVITSLTNSGLLQVAASTTFYLAQVTLLPSTTFAGSGLLYANGNTIIPGNVTITLPLLLTGTFSGAGTLQLAANATWNAPGQSIINLAGGVDVNSGVTFTLTGIPANSPTFFLIDSSLRNHGTIVWSVGNIVLRNSSTFTNASNGQLEVQGSLTMNYDGNGTPAFVNSGTLFRSGAPNRLTVMPPFTNTGTFDVRIGGMSAGQLDEFGGTTIALGGTLSAHLLNGLVPGPTDQFKIMDGTSGSGAFSTFVGDGFTFSACYTPTAVFVCNVVTQKITPTITWSNPADISYGTALGATQLNATASVPGTFAYTPPAGTVLNAGNGQQLQVAFTPTDTAHYNNANASVSINVVRATPTITWATPADIVYGTALSGTQLNATANTAGTFVYTPAAGVKLHAGNAQPLSASFTPTDTANYQPVNAVRSINVLRAGLTVAAANASKVFGAPLPTFSAGFSGFVNGDTPASLAGTLLLATTATATSPVGTYPITASGLTSGDYTIAFAPGTLTINQAGTTTTSLVVPSTAGFLQPVFAVAIIAPVAPGAGAPGGVVQFKDGTTPLGSATVIPIPGTGVAFLVVNGLASGPHSITVAYGGDTNFSASTSSAAAVTISPVAASTLTFVIPQNSPQAAGLPATLSAYVLSLGGATPTGTVQFSSDGAVIGSAPIVGGVATLSPTTLPVGTHVVTAQYAGNASLAASGSPPAVVTIYSGTRPATTASALTSSSSPSTLGQTVTFTATVTGGATSGTVSFYSDGIAIGQAPLANVGGSFKATLPTAALSSGIHFVTAVYLGSPGFASSSAIAGQVVQAPGGASLEVDLPALLKAVP
jgi:Tol biopolymer transport system component